MERETLYIFTYPIHIYFGVYRLRDLFFKHPKKTLF